MLATLKASGKKLSIASSKPTQFVERILDYFEIRTYFDVIVGSNMDGTRSKKEEVVEEALRQLVPSGMTPDGKKAAVAMVGDRRFDIEGAKEHGITSVGVSFGYAPEGELEQAGADFIVDTVDALLEVLNG